MLKVKSKIWIEKDNELIFGDGKFKVLQAVSEEGSINKAAKKLAMSYKKAWSSIQAIETRLGMELVQKNKGGANGGSSELTKSGKRLLENYNNFREGINNYVDTKFKKIFTFKEI
ncbi:winged helix-turn-helix domain-containing protein [bacterium]